MNEYIEERLQNLLIQFLALNPSKLPLRFYMKQMREEFVSIPDEAIRYAIDTWEKEEMYKTKPLNYFKAIVKGKYEDMKVEKDKEKRRLGGLPRNIV